MPNILLNEKDAGPVIAPAFALTKVSTLAVVLVSTVGTSVVKLLGVDGFSADQTAMLGAAVLSFLAVVIAADVLARALALLGEARQPVVPLPAPIDARVEQGGRTRDVRVVAWSKDRLLCVAGCHDARLSWESSDDVAIQGR